VVERLPDKCKALNANPTTAKKIKKEEEENKPAIGNARERERERETLQILRGCFRGHNEVTFERT
jgi:hypothetical protein